MRCGGGKLASRVNPLVSITASNFLLPIQISNVVHASPSSPRHRDNVLVSVDVHPQPRSTTMTLSMNENDRDDPALHEPARDDDPARGDDDPAFSSSSNVQCDTKSEICDEIVPFGVEKCDSQRGLHDEIFDNNNNNNSCNKINHKNSDINNDNSNDDVACERPKRSSSVASGHCKRREG